MSSISNYAQGSKDVFDTSKILIRLVEPVPAAIRVVEIMPDIFTALRKQTTEWLAASGYHRSDLAKELNWSESFLSEFMSGKSGIGGLRLCQLTAVVSQSPRVKKFNKGARICSVQSMGRTIKGVLQLNEANMAEFADSQTEVNRERMTTAARNHNANTTFSGKE